MARTQYESKRVSADRRRTMEQANEICEQYAAQGLVLTLRQLYYQFVARGLIPNSQREYSRLGDACGDARMLGIMDWDHLIDRTRSLSDWKTYRGPEAALQELAKRYHRDMWATQHQRVEVWVEKDAAVGVIEGVCSANSVPYFAARGYASMSAMHDAAQRVRWHVEAGSQVTILYIGDHDPSGLDMTRDVEDRLRQFISRDWAGLHMGPGSHTRGTIRASMREHMAAKRLSKDGDAGHASVYRDVVHPWQVKRIALNLDQVEEYQPPPNPAKQSDARYARYVEETGLDESWELDALEPTVLQDLITAEVDALRDEEAWAEAEFTLATDKRVLTGASNYYDEIAALVAGKDRS
jgi:hypothetical protein